jgi:hypothetical protein
MDRHAGTASIVSKSPKLLALAGFLMFVSGQQNMPT